MNKLERAMQNTIPVTVETGKLFTVSPVPFATAEGKAVLGVKDPEDLSRGTLALVEVNLNGSDLEMTLGNLQDQDVQYRPMENRFVHWKNPLANASMILSLMSQLTDYINKESGDV